MALLALFLAVASLNTHISHLESAVPSFPMYDPLPTTGVSYFSSNTPLQLLLSHGELSEAGNAHQFYAPEPPLPEQFNVLVEGAEYIGAWLETQPMAGAMWATRSVRLALDNQLVFIRTQRSDGRYSHR